jgi:hypothetical protein
MGNFWSEQSESLINAQSHFLNSPSIESFKDVEDRLSWCDKYKLGYPYKVWHTACLYHFMMTQRTNLTSDKLVCDYLDIEQDVITGFENAEEWAIYPMLILWRVTEKNKYYKIINHVNNQDYKAKVDRVLSDSMI